MRIPLAVPTSHTKKGVSSMRKLFLTVLLTLALVFAASASAFTQSGHVQYNIGGPFAFGTVTICDQITHACGSTGTDVNGNYTFTGLDSSHNYLLRATGCKVHSGYASPWTAYYPPLKFPTLTVSPSGGC